MSQDRPKKNPPEKARTAAAAPAVIVKRDTTAPNPFEQLTPGLLPSSVVHTPRPQSAKPSKPARQPSADAAPATAKPLVKGPMQVDIVDRLDALAGLREDWDAAYAADPEAHIFISWSWLHNWLRRRGDGWFILVATPNAAGARPVAFFALRVTEKKWKDSWFYNEIQPGCGFADCTGFVCRPEFEAQVIPAFAEQLGQMNWARVDVDRLRISDRRLALLRPHLGSERTEAKVSDTNVESGIDLFRCPYTNLPDDWDTYLTQTLSANSRQKARRLLRKIEQGDVYRVTHATPETIERDIEALLRLWTSRWGAQKGERLNNILRANRLMLKDCFVDGALFVPTLWKDDKPLAVHAILKDAQKKAMLFFIGGRDQEFKEMSPAFALHAYGIRHAIAEGFKVYDFLRGDEPYKFTFAKDEYRLKRIAVVTKDRRNLGGKLLPRSLPFVFKQSFELHQKGNLKEAEIGYRQMLEVDPRSADALFGLGQIVAARGDHKAAMETFKAYLASKNPPPKR